MPRRPRRQVCQVERRGRARAVSAPLHSSYPRVSFPHGRTRTLTFTHIRTRIRLRRGRLGQWRRPRLGWGRRVHGGRAARHQRDGRRELCWEKKRESVVVVSLLSETRARAAGDTTHVGVTPNKLCVCPVDRAVRARGVRGLRQQGETKAGARADALSTSTLTSRSPPLQRTHSHTPLPPPPPSLPRPPSPPPGPTWPPASAPWPPGKPPSAGRRPRSAAVGAPQARPPRAAPKKTGPAAVRSPTTTSMARSPRARRPPSGRGTEPSWASSSA
jgi:hypothetical protein